ncbi:haloacid dehalogenase [Caldivirga sp. UBA161]|uniref:haloacid dehalogenase n=1 Tax=Caldivirga sp. UBA161 TaxID=1915569 RepID=UPI0025B7B0D2|nr:haloacid dehalogenase [Caldivirga sp. UBA161]
MLPNRDSIKAKLREYEDARDKVINTGIRLNRLSKSVIYSVIRNDWEAADKYLSDMRRELESLMSLIKQYPFYYDKAAVSFQEYAEAYIMYEFNKSGRIPTIEEVGVDELAYLNGLMEFTGELSRKATEELIKDNLEYALKAKETMEDIYLDMLYMEFRDFEMRKKVDYVANNINWLNEKIFYKTLNRGKPHN